MFDGNRATTAKSVIWIALALTAVGFVFFTYFQGFNLGEEIGNSAYSADYHEQYATDRIERECIGRNMAGFELHECIEEQIKTSYEHHTAYADLKAQTRMANWAVLMGVFTFFAMLFTGVGVVFVYRTLIVTREIGQAQVRAYVGIAGSEFKNEGGSFFGPGDELKCEIMLKNFGNSPAYISKIVRWEKTVGTALQSRLTDLTPPHDPVVVSGGVVLGSQSGFTIVIDNIISEVEAVDLHSGAAHSFLFGEITYQDVFRNQDHVFKYCLRVENYGTDRVRIFPFGEGENAT